MAPYDPASFIFADPRRRRIAIASASVIILLLCGGLLCGLFGVSVLSPNPLPSLSIQPETLHLCDAPPAPHQEPPLAAHQKADLLERKLRLVHYRELLQRLSSAVPLKAPKMAGFYVAWDPASFNSLRQNINQLSTVYPEWFRLVNGQGDIAPIPDAYAPAFLREHPDVRVLPLITNFDSKKLIWMDKELSLAVSRPAARRRLIRRLARFVTTHHYAGLMLDFEQIRPYARKRYVQFVQEAATEFHKRGKVLDVTISFDNYDKLDNAALARAADHVCVMAYDEHYGSSVAGPVASLPWFAEHLRQRAAEIPASKLILALGAYGYDWTVGHAGAASISYEDALMLASQAHSRILFDPRALNPTLRYRDDGGYLHEIWYLDAVTFYNQLHASLPYKPSGLAFWRLGSEDPGVWRILAARSRRQIASRLAVMDYGYDLYIKGKGAVIRVDQEVRQGRRRLRWDARTGLITEEVIRRFPSPTVIQHYGQRPRAITLTFDDGPDPLYTPKILDILKRYHIKATFFVIGQSAQMYPGLVRRMYREGHTVGSHTFTHPNITEISEKRLAVELNATQLLLQSILGVRTVLFRPPYSLGTEPVFPDEALAVERTSRFGYLMVGNDIEPKDYALSDPKKIIALGLKQLPEGNIILLHDGGRHREPTVKSLPGLIEGIRARGYHVVSLPQLLRQPRSTFMPSMGAGQGGHARVAGTFFMLLSVALTFMSSALVTGMLLGLIRFVVYTALALWQRWRQGSFPAPLPTTEVDVVIPAHNEATVINATIRSVLNSQGLRVRVIVVDDGSTDGLAETVLSQFGAHPQVELLVQPNRGKWAALDYGVEWARSECVVLMDADTIFDPVAIRELIAPFADARIGAVAGNAKVGNRVNYLTRWQALEYITAQNLDRRANAVLNCITVVPGAVGAWRREVLMEIGGFRPDTLAEDAEATIRILRAGYRVAYASRAIGWTEAPQTIYAFSRQRFRWIFGTLQAAWKHRGVLFRRGSSTLGWIALPNVFLFQVVLPILAPLMDLMMVLSIAFSFLQHPAGACNFTAMDIQRNLFLYGMFLLIDWLSAAVSFALEPEREEWLLLFWLPVQRLLYRQLMYVYALRSLLAAVSGRPVGWGHNRRTAAVLDRLAS